MLNQAKLEPALPSDSVDFSRMKTAMSNVDLNPMFTDMTDRSILEHLVAAEQELDTEVSARASVERQKELTTHHYQLRRGRLREMFNVLNAEIEAEETAAHRDIDRRIRVLNVAVDAKRAAISVLKQKPVSE